MEQWYALHTKPRAEFRVAQALQKRNFEVFVPHITVARADSRKVEVEPFFPCYLFLKTRAMQLSPLLNEWMPGVRGIVTYGEEPVPVFDYVIETIKRELDNQSAHSNPKASPFHQGDTIRVTKGPFADMLGIFNGPTTPDKRVQILLRLLGQLSRVWLDADHITRVSAAPQTVVANKQSRRTRGRGRPIK